MTRPDDSPANVFTGATSKDGSPTPRDRWDAAGYDGHHSFVWKYGAALIDLLAPQPHELILDLGCGTGHLTQALADAGADVVGIDASEAMLTEARRRYPQLRFQLADARTFDLVDKFDAIFSNATLHWVQPPQLAIDRMFRALKPGGRLVCELGGKGNVRQVLSALAAAVHDVGMAPLDAPHYFPSVSEYTTLLEQRGFEVQLACLFDRPTPLEGTDKADTASHPIARWVQTFHPLAVAAAAPTQRDELLQQLVAHARPTLFRDGIWYADYRRLRIVATRTSG